MRFTNVIFFLLISFFSFSEARDYWGSIALNEQTGIDGISLDASTKAEAISRAIKNCKNKNKNKGVCKSMLHFSNACGAVAWSPTAKKGKSGGGEHASKEAEIDALNDCKGVGLYDCKIVASLCTSWETIETWNVVW